MRNNLVCTLVTFFGVLTTSFSYADVIEPGDMVVQGASCIGFDCVDGEVFGSDVLRLKENNLRLRFVDLSASDALVRGWNLTANDSVNGGDSYFSFEVKSLVRDEMVLSDGTAILWDCSSGFPIDTGNLIPAGEPALDPNNNCAALLDFSVDPVLKYSTTSQGGVAIGHESQLSPGVISVGKADLLRKIMHVAQSVADTDLLTTKSLNDYPVSGPVMVQLDTIEAQLTELERVVDVMSKSSVTSGSGAFDVMTVLLLLTVVFSQLYARRHSWSSAAERVNK